MKLDEFRLESYKERQLLINALCYYRAHRQEDIVLQGLEEAYDSLTSRVSKTECQPGGCSICNPDDYAWRYDND